MPGSLCHCVLVERDGQQVRLDFAEAAWSGPPIGTIGYWRCRVPQPDGRPRPLDTEALLRYFEQLSDDPNPVQEKFRYVLALLLLQKRRLILEGSRRDGEIEYLRLIGSQSEGPYEVRDQQLTDDEIQHMQTELSTRLAEQWC